MRALRIPCFVLLLLLALSVANGIAMGRRCDLWLETVDAADRAAAAQRWDQADDRLAELERQLENSALWLHVTTTHNTVDEAQRLLSRARLMCRLEDGARVRESLAELRVLLRQAKENEQLLLGNIM